MSRHPWMRFLLPTLLGASLLACTSDKPQFNSVDITGADYGKALVLADTEGKPRSLTDFSGKVVAVFFGFTQCPDACPTSMALLADVMQRLGKDAERVQVIFVTVDPERDTPAQLKAYATAFNPSFIALHGSLADTTVITKAFNVFFEKHGDIAGGKYTIDHTVGTYVFDPKGRTRLFMRQGETPERMVADIKLLLAGN